MESDNSALDVYIFIFNLDLTIFNIPQISI